MGVGTLAYGSRRGEIEMKVTRSIVVTSCLAFVIACLSGCGDGPNETGGAASGKTPADVLPDFAKLSRGMSRADVDSITGSNGSTDERGRVFYNFGDREVKVSLTKIVKVKVLGLRLAHTA